MPLEVLSAAEFMKRYPPKNYVTADETHITINVEYEYHIPIDDCKTHERLLGWIIHLSEKNWVTGEVLRQFILKACTINNLTIKY